MNRMKRTVLTALIALAAGTSAAAAERTLPDEWKAAPRWLTLRAGAGGAWDVVDFKGNCILSLGSFACGYPVELDAARRKRGAQGPLIGRCLQTVRNVTPTGDGAWRIDYACGSSSWSPEDCPRAVLKNAYALVTADRSTLTVEYHVTAPHGARFHKFAELGNIYTYQTFVPDAALKFHEKPMNTSYGKRPAVGAAYEARGVALNAADAPSGRFYYAGGKSFAQGQGGRAFSLKWLPTDKAAAEKAAAELMKFNQVMPATAEAMEALKNAPKSPTGEEESDLALDEKPVEKKELKEAPVDYVATLKFQLLPGAGLDQVAACAANGQFLALELTTPAKLNLFDVTKGERPQVTLRTFNPSEKPLTCDLRVQAWDWDGKTVLKDVKKTTWEPFGERTAAFDLPADRERDFFFVEASVVDAEGRECFTRTQLATLPPHDYRHRDTSFLGVQCDYPIPDYETLGKLMVRMGVHWIRAWSKDVDWVGKWGMEVLAGFGRGNQRRGADRLKVAKAELEKARDHGATIFEIGGNEMNFPYKLKADLDKERREIDDLLDWMRTFYEARYQLGLERKIRLSTFGFGGSDYAFAGLMNAVGCFDYLDFLSLHPGRLNQTPDSHGPDWAWHFLPQVDMMRNILLDPKVRGERELGLILTETYARTPPNKADSDTLRSAAENVLLTLILAKTRDVRTLIWYKSHDGAYWDINGVNEHNSEYHYGLLLRDGRVKPSILGWCAAAEMLDGATFKGCGAFPDKRRAWVFDTPRGEAAVLVDRTDGEAAYPMDVPHKDPWIDHWKTFNRHEFAAAGDEVTVIDTIGRARKVAAKDGKVTLTLSGSPVIVYGLKLELDPKQTWKPLHDAKRKYPPYENEHDVKRAAEGVKGLDEEPEPAGRLPNGKKPKPKFDMGVKSPDMSEMSDMLSE